MTEDRSQMTDEATFN